MRYAIRTASLLSLTVLSAAAGPTTVPTSQPATAPAAAAAVDWSEAAKHVGETVTVTGPVKGTHVAGKNVVLNVGADYPDKSRFCIMLPFDDTKGSADDQFKDKTATVTGTVKMYKKTPEIVAKTAAEVTLK